MVVGMEQGVGSLARWYGREIETSSKVNLGGFMKDHINIETKVKTDCWSVYMRMNADFLKLVCEKYEKRGENFNQKYWLIMMFKS